MGLGLGLGLVWREQVEHLAKESTRRRTDHKDGRVHAARDGGGDLVRSRVRGRAKVRVRVRARVRVRVRDGGGDRDAREDEHADCVDE